jgi:hypothetical protein
VHRLTAIAHADRVIIDGRDAARASGLALHRHVDLYLAAERDPQVAALRRDDQGAVRVDATINGAGEVVGRRGEPAVPDEAGDGRGAVK